MTVRHYLQMSSPLGQLMLYASDEALTEVRWSESKTETEADKSTNNALLIEAAKQLSAFFLGTLRDFDLPLAPKGTVFQQRVWEALSMQEFGTFTTYGNLAKRIGNPKAARAVGGAVGANPLPIIIPCHRVLGAGGAIGGFSGGLARKLTLLAIEEIGE